MSQQVEAMMGMPYTQPMPPLDIFLTDGYQLPLGNHRIDVMHTPGHSPGSVVFYVADEHCLFAGDTLFRMSVGRTDLEGGSWTAMMKSLQRIATTLSKDTVVYCGHGPSTTLADELRMNPYFK
jgi:glyoxylase-like metal-dependent hydrolase (beta-lactamase superfamily II)